MAKLVPPRFNEGWGTWHAKIYDADDDVMVSGANLNNAYFTNRRDRYIFFKNQPHLSNYCFDFLQTVSTFSYRLLPNETSTNTNTNPHSYSQEDYSIVWPDPDTHPHHINSKAQKALSSLQASHRSSQHDLSPSSVMLFPIIQAGQFNIHEEEHFFQLLFRHLKEAPLTLISAKNSSSSAGTNQVNSALEKPLIDLTSGYFGLYERYRTLLLTNPRVNVRIVAASPMANGFFGSKGMLRTHPNATSIVAPALIDTRVIAAEIGDRKAKSQLAHLSSWSMLSRELCDCIGHAIRILRSVVVGETSKPSIYVPDLNWSALHRDFGSSPLYSHLVELGGNESDSQANNEDKEDPMQLLRALVLRFLDANPADFSPEMPFTSYGLDSLSAGRMAFALAPWIVMTQVQLLADVSLNDLVERIEGNRQ